MEKVIKYNHFSDIKLRPNHIFFVSSIVYNIYKSDINSITNNVIVLDENNNFENIKSFDVVKNVIESLIENNINRDDYVYCLGGGSIGDLIGFCTSIYKRGVNLVHIPSTLLSAVDSSIGGKNAINFQDIKNILGTFKVANEVILVRDIFNNLSSELINQGRGELFKYYLLDKSIDKNDIFSNDFINVVEKSIKYKQKIVEIDPYDQNERFVLNLGHSLGHVIESTLKISHGNSIVYGIYLEAIILRHKNIVTEEVFDEIQTIFNNFNLDKIMFKNIDFEYKLSHDKKIVNNRLVLPFIKNIGEYDFLQINIDEIKDIIDELPFEEI